MHWHKFLAKLHFHFCANISSWPHNVGADLLEFAALENAEVVSGRKIFQTAANSVRRQTLRKQLGNGSRKRKGIISGN